MLSIPESEEFARPGSVLYLRVADIHAATEAIRGRAELVAEPHRIHSDGRIELWMTFFRDGEGNTLAFASEVPVGG